MNGIGIDVSISKNIKKGFSTISLANDYIYYDIWELASKLQRAEFTIKKIVKDNLVFEYDSESYDESKSGEVTSIIMEYNYDNKVYYCEINEELIIIRPIFEAEDILKRKIYECIVDPASVYLQTAIENIESAELNLSIGSTRSASSDIYYASHNLLKSIQYSFTEDEKILTSDRHSPLFLANIKINVSDEEYSKKLEASFKSELGKIEPWLRDMSPAISKVEEGLIKNYEPFIKEFYEKIDLITEKILETCKKRVESEHKEYNIYNFLMEIRNKINSYEGISTLTKKLAIPMVAAYEARVLADYKFNFESILSRDYISLLHWFVEELIKLVKIEAESSNYVRKNIKKKSNVEEIYTVANKKAKNSILGIIRISDSSFEPKKLKDLLVNEWEKSISIIDWKNEYPIKLNILKTGKSPITIDISDGNQIDVYTPYSEGENLLQIKLNMVEDIIEKIYEFLIENWPNAQLKISPITLTYQHKIIKQNYKSKSRPVFLERRKIESNLLKIFKHVNNICISNSTNRGLCIEFKNVKVNVDVLSIEFDEYGRRPITRYISDIIGYNFIRRSRLSCDFTILFMSQSNYNHFRSEDRIHLFSQANIMVYPIDDTMWQKLTLEGLIEEDIKVLSNVFSNISELSFQEVAIGKE